MSTFMGMNADPVETSRTSSVFRKQVVYSEISTSILFLRRWACMNSRDVSMN